MIQRGLWCVLFCMTTAVAACQHARAAAPPSAAVDAADTPRVVQLHHAYYLFGLLPRNIELVAEDLCPAGIRGLDQYTSFTDGLFEQLTLGIYSPRTVEVTCR